MSLESELADLHQPLLRYAQLQLRNESLAEDVVSETFLAILEKPGAFEGRSSLRTYATGIPKFRIIDVIRENGREVQIFDVLQVCVDRLPPQIGRAFMMREWLQREVEDICAELRITTNYCGVMLYRARMKLRECLGAGWFEGQR